MREKNLKTTFYKEVGTSFDKKRISKKQIKEKKPQKISKEEKSNFQSGQHLNLKIQTGKYKGKKMIFANSVRPSLARARKFIFDVVQSHCLKNIRLNFSKFCVLDCFAGSGVLGIEAYSNGSLKVFLIDNSIESINCIKKNVNSIPKNNNLIQKDEKENQNPIQIIHSDFFKLNSLNEIFDLIFIDPPYLKIDPIDVIKFLLNCNYVRNETIIIVDVNFDYKTEKLNKIPSFIIMKEKRIGNTKIIIGYIEKKELF